MYVVTFQRDGQTVPETYTVRTFKGAEQLLEELIDSEKVEGTIWWRGSISSVHSFDY